MPSPLAFLHGVLDYPRGATIVVRDHAGYRAYRAGRAVARRLRHRDRAALVHRLGPADFPLTAAHADGSAAAA